MAARNDTIRILALSGAATAILFLSACAHHPADHLAAGGIADANADSTERIRQGFMRLGASEAKSVCFADVLSNRLDPGARSDAVEIIESADSRREMRSGVMTSTREIRGAFIAANMRCSMAG